MVDRLSLSIPAERIFGLLGPNGAGKSTTVKMLTTPMPPSSGSASVGGFDIVREPAAVRGVIGYVPQLVSADAALTGVENLLLSARLYGLPRAGRAARIHDALAFMGLADAGKKLVRTYSGGMVRRLELAQALLHRPRVLFLDEPTIGLDPVARETLWDRLEGMRKDFGTTIFMTTHDMEEADVLCDTLALLHEGRVAALGTPAELKALVAPGASLGDVFRHFAGTSIQGGSFDDARSARVVAKRLG
ncbi:MAG: ATP-binding cassette domain-containing protein [Myxococcota bacterium]